MRAKQHQTFSYCFIIKNDERHAGFGGDFWKLSLIATRAGVCNLECEKT